ncbi:MAG: AAA family ATPase [Desulfobacterales bacterium]
MYRNHFGLAKKPFEISPDPDFLWLGEKHREGLAVLKYGILENKGFLLITGEVGTGKTALIRAIEKEVKARAIIVTIPDPGMGLMDFYQFLASELNIERDFRNKGEFLARFKRLMLEHFSGYRRVLLIIDESQRLNHELLEEIRLLSNIDLEGKVLINIFFVGQSEFRDILAREENRAVRQRITVSYHLPALEEAETGQYIQHRLRVAGARGEIFTPAAVRAVHEFSKGLPRLINIVCDHAMMTGYIRGVKTIDADIVRECGRELGITIGEDPALRRGRAAASGKAAAPAAKQNAAAREGAPAPSWRRPALFFAIVLLGLFGGWYFWGEAVSQQLALWGKTREPAAGALPGGKERSAALQAAPALPVETGPRGPQAAAEPAAPAPGAFSGAAEPLPRAPAAREAAAPKTAPETSGEENRSVPEAPPPAAPAFVLQEFTVLFEPNSVDLTPRAREIIATAGGLLRASPGTAALVEGHSDGLGDPAYNMYLSGKRAMAVRNQLLAQGLDAGRLKLSAFGAERPLDTNETLEGRNRNRRVVIRIVPQSGP